MMTTPLDQRYWDLRYEQNQTAWDLGEVSPPLKEYFMHRKETCVSDRALSVLIPGGGNSHEAEYLMQQGYTDVTVVDISSVVIHSLTTRLAQYLDKGLKLIHQDFFTHTCTYDLMVEQTFFCALAPELRTDYVQHVRQLLNPNGKLVGVLFDRDFAGGPPFGGHKSEYLALFDHQLEVLTMEPCYNSIAPRAGSEVFFIAKKS